MDFSNFEKKHAIIAGVLLVLIVFVVALGIWSRIPPKKASASGYSYYRAITVTSNTSIASGTETNFPMLVSSTFSTWEPVSDGGHIQNLVTAPNGGQEPADLIFSTSTACSAPLNFETESYTSSTGALVDWVDVPSLSAGTVIYACYGSSAVTTDQSSPNSTWNSTYKGVWHFPNSGSLGKDSTANANNGTVNSVTAGTGDIGGGATNSGNNNISLSGPALGSNATTTISAWIDPDGTHLANSEAILSDGTGGNALQVEGGKLDLLSGGIEGATTTYVATTSVTYLASDGTNMWVENTLGLGSTSTLYEFSPTGTILGTYSQFARLSGIAFDGTNMWVVNKTGGTVNKVSPTGTILATYATGQSGLIGIAFDGTNMWVTNSLSPGLIKITPAGATTTYTIGPNADGIAFDGTNMWVASDNALSTASSGLMKVSPTGTWTPSNIGGKIIAVAFDGTNMWATNDASNTVVEVSPTGTTMAAIPAGGVPDYIAFDGTNMWVTIHPVSGNGSLLKITPTGVTSTYPDPGNPGEIAFDGTNMWVTNSASGTVTKFAVGAYASPTIASGAWTHVAATISGSGAMQLYVNGVARSNCVTYILPLSFCATSGNAFGGTMAYLMNNGGTAPFYGSIDEVEVANTFLSSQWILTEYNNQNSPSTFYTIGAENTISVSYSYSYYRAITVSANASGTQTNFPMLVSSTLSTWESTSTGGHIQNLVTAPNGGQEPADLIFVTSTPTLSGSVYNCGTSLSFETEKYTSSTGALIDWVNVPSITAGTVIYVCYGSSAATTDQSSPSLTWNSNYKTVLHFPSPTSTLNVLDSTGDFSPTNNGATVATAGEIDGGGAFNGGTQYVDVGALSTNYSAITVDAWFNSSNVSNDNSRIVSNSHTDIDHDGFQLMFNSGGTNGFFDVGNGSIEIAASWTHTISNSTWYHYVGTYDGTNARAYINGALVATSASASGNVITSGVDVNVGRGAAYNGDYFPGTIDEVRISNAALSSSWILTEYNNESSPSTFYTMGSETAPSSGYAHFRAITVSANASGTQTNFPMLVSSTLSTWESTSTGGHIQNLVTAPNGGQEPADLIFVTSTPTLSGSVYNCGTSLSFETEKYTSSTGALIDWVNVPSISAGTVIYACYGNSTVTTDQSSPSSTWNSNYDLVWHLPAPNGTWSGADSTSHVNSVNNSNAASTTTGEIGGGIDMSPNQSKIDDSSGVSLPTGNTTTFTIQGWQNSTAEHELGIIFGFGSPDTGTGGAQRFLLSYDNEYYFWGGGNDWGTGVTWDADSHWHYWAITYNGPSNNITFYRDGVLAAQTNSYAGGSNGTAGTDIRSGYASNWAITLSSKLDEERISSVVLSPSWILTEYNNESSTSAFYTMGAEDVSAGGGTTTSTWISSSNQSWSSASNWSGGAIPGSSTNVLFSGSSTVNCSIDSNANVSAFTIASGYTGTITPAGGDTLTTNATSGFSQAAGTFTGNAATMDDSGSFTLSGGTFTATKGLLYLYNGATLSGGTFNNNSGTVVFGTGSTPVTISGSATFYDLELGDGSGLGSNLFTIATGTTLTVQASTTFSPALRTMTFIGGGTVATQGDVDLATQSGSTAPTSTINLTLNGFGNQTINDGGNSNSSHPFYLPSLTINKTNGVAYVSSTYLVVQSTTIANGELNLVSASTSAAQTFVATSTLTINSGGTLSDYAYVSSTVTLGSSITNNGEVFFDGSGAACYASSSFDYLTVNSTLSGTQRPWSGSGLFLLRYVSAKDQSGTASISDLNGISISNNGSNWSFPTGAVPELVQSSTVTAVGLSQGGSTLPHEPRAGDLILAVVNAQSQSISAPTDSVGNTYILVASSTFGSSPSYSLSLYYAKNIVTTSSLTVTFHLGGTSPSAEIALFEYTGMDPSSTFDSYSSNAPLGAATLATSLTATGASTNELYFGTAITGSGSLTAGAGWKTETPSGSPFDVEDVSTSSALSTAATWAVSPSSTYAAILGIFHSPYIPGYSQGTLDSATFDTGVASGSQLNSYLWQGNTPSNSSVGFQFAVSNSSGGPWNFEGPDGTASTYFTGSPGNPVNLVATTNGYTLFNGYRYFRYRVTLFSDSTHTYTPTVTQVSVNWSP